ncbi:MAG: beta-lactamase-like protein [Candidatus Angelobacter sp.]|nr:beta-lactamase-like protein [Candidatus Angelobacter sp.]
MDASKFFSGVRMPFRRFLLTSAFIVSLVSVSFAQHEDYSKVEIKVQKVAGTVYMLVGAGGNIGASVGDDGIVIVDDQFAPLAPKIQAALKGITDKPVRFIINTHYHGDHTGGNAEFSKQGTIIAQENVRKRLMEGSKTRFGTTPPAPKEALPIITFNDRASVHLNGEDIRAIHFPAGHTDGDSVIFFTQSNVIHMGDDFVTYGFPFVDVDNGGSVTGMIAGVEKVLATAPPDTKYIPGHGALSTADDVRKFVQMLKDTRALVSDAVKKDQTAAQMKEAKIMAKFEDQYGKGFLKSDEWIDTLYADVTANKSAAAYHNHGHADEAVKK